MPREAFNLFISYAHKDAALRRALEEHLAPLEREGEVHAWHDREIAAGDEWRGQIDERLESADLILLLVSSSFLASDYCFDVETRRALERHARGEARVIPIIIRPCDWKSSNFAELQALPKDGKPVTTWRPRDQAWLDVARGLRIAITELRVAERQRLGKREERQPSYTDDESKRLSQRLKALFQQRKDLTVAGDDTRAIEGEILDVRRLLRKGPQLQPGEFLGDGRYELIEAIGQGGFATVWKAWDHNDHRLVALKVLHGHYSEDRGKRERFLRGARKMAELAHPHIVRVLETECADDGWHFFVMEYLSGGNFEQAVLRDELTPERRLENLLQAGEALEHAHRQGAIHRDVKPSNILLDGEGTAKLSDFDLVRAADTTGLTATRAMMGTVQFAAPEALESAGAVGPAADVYSLGSTAVFALSGRLAAWYYRDPRRAIAELNCGEELKRVLERATAFQDEGRYGSVAEFRRALAEARQRHFSVRQKVSSAGSELVSSSPVATSPPRLPRAIRPLVSVEDTIRLRGTRRLMGDSELPTIPARDAGDVKEGEGKWRWILGVAFLAVLVVVSWVRLRPLLTDKAPMVGVDGKTQLDSPPPPLPEPSATETENLGWEAEDTDESPGVQSLPPAARPNPSAGGREPSVGGESTVEKKPPPSRPSLAATKSAGDEIAGLRAGSPTDGPIGMRFRYAPAGTLRMGSPETEIGRDDDESPHKVKLTRSFWIGETVVTQGQWQLLMDNNPSSFGHCGEECPVETVNWFEAVAFANRLSGKARIEACYQLSECNEKKPGEDYKCTDVRFKGLNCRGYRLPTEAEWEYAARAGEEGAIYTGKLTIQGTRKAPELDAIAWYGGNSKVEYPGGFDCSNWSERQYPSESCGTQRVGRKLPNKWQVHDMLGNVWEWAWDWKADYQQELVTNPTGPEKGSSRVVRGGSWNFNARYCRSASRGGGAPGGRYAHVGFRLVRTAD